MNVRLTLTTRVQTLLRQYILPASRRVNVFSLPQDFCREVCTSSFRGVPSVRSVGTWKLAPEPCEFSPYYEFTSGTHEAAHYLHHIYISRDALWRLTLSRFIREMEPRTIPTS